MSDGSDVADLQAAYEEREAQKDLIVAAIASAELENIDDLDSVARQALPAVNGRTYVSLVTELVDERLVRASPVTIGESRAPIDWSIERLSPTGRQRAVKVQRKANELSGQAAVETESQGSLTITATATGERTLSPEERALLEPLIAELWEKYQSSKATGPEIEAIHQELVEINDEVRSEAPSNPRIAERLRAIRDNPLFNSLVSPVVAVALTLLVDRLRL